MSNFDKIRKNLTIKYCNKFGKNANPNKVIEIAQQDNFNESNINFIANNLYFWYDMKRYYDDQNNLDNLDVMLYNQYCQSEFNTTLGIISKILNVEVKNKIMRSYYEKIKN
jgi:hypothetical protein